MRPLLSSNKTVLYHVNGPTTVSIIVFEKGLMDTERETYEILRDKRVTVSLNEPLPGSGPDFEMSRFCCSLEIFRTPTISQNNPHSIYFKNSNMTPRL